MTLESLSKDFGIESLNYDRFIRVLVNIINSDSSKSFQVSFSNWKKHFSDSCDYDFQKVRSSLMKLTKRFNQEEVEFDKSIFNKHREIVVLVKGIANNKHKMDYQKQLQMLVSELLGETHIRIIVILIVQFFL